MKNKDLKFVISLFLAVLLWPMAGQNVCNPNGNLIIYTNYDGGTLNINVDQNIPNLIIGVVGYEATSINLSGTFVGNVTAVHYAGYNGTNNPCGGVLATSINGAPVAAATSTVFAPAATISNPNGYGMIICGYSCSNNTNQGGCNTVDQIEAYFLSLFPNSSLYAHMVQYSCWSGTYSVSSGGSCCPLSPFLQGSISGSQTVCAGSTLTPFTSSVAASGGTGTIMYQWESSVVSPSSGFSAISGATLAAFSPTPVLVTTYFRRGAGTSLNPTLYSNVVSVSVTQTASLSVAGPTQVCSPTIGTLYAFAQGAVSYSWASSTGITSYADSMIVGSFVQGVSVFSCTAFFANNNCSATTMYSVNVVPGPTVIATGTAVCPGQSAVLMASGLVSYQWMGPSGYMSNNQTASVPLANNSTAGTYTVVGTNENQCPGTATALLGLLPLPPVLVTTSNTLICSGQSAILSASGAQTYSWVSPVSSTGQVAVVSPPVGNTTYSVSGVDANGCSNTAAITIQVSICTEMEDVVLKESSLFIYPNPNAGSFYIQAKRSTTLLFYGQSMQNFGEFTLDHTNNYAVFMQNLEPGLYYLVEKVTGAAQKVVIIK